MSAPTFYAFRNLPPSVEECRAAWPEMGDKMKAEGATYFRMTIVSDEHPRPPYPHGLYMEGWLERPHPEPDFAFPLTYAQPGAEA